MVRFADAPKHYTQRATVKFTLDLMTFFVVNLNSVSRTRRFLKTRPRFILEPMKTSNLHKTKKHVGVEREAQKSEVHREKMRKNNRNS